MRKGGTHKALVAPLGLLTLDVENNALDRKGRLEPDGLAILENGDLERFIRLRVDSELIGHRPVGFEQYWMQRQSMGHDQAGAQAGGLTVASKDLALLAEEADLDDDCLGVLSDAGSYWLAGDVAFKEFSRGIGVESDVLGGRRDRVGRVEAEGADLEFGLEGRECRVGSPW